MTSILKEDKMRQKLGRKKVEDEESRSFLKISRENLSISHSDLEQGFSKSQKFFRPNKSTALSVLALLFASTCIVIEIWKLQRVLENNREIQILKRDIETLKHRFLEEDLLDELKAFEEQLYAENGNNLDDDDDLDDYESDYDDDYSRDYPSRNVSESNKNWKESLAALYEREAKKVQEIEQNVRKNVNRERDHNKRTLENQTHTTKKRSVQDDFLVMPYLRNRSMSLFNDDDENRHLPKEFHIQESHAYLTSLLNAMKKEENIEKEKMMKKEEEQKSSRRKRKKSVQKNESLRLQRREMTTPRQLRPPRQVSAVHYEADSTLFSSEDEHTGNGRAKHSSGVFKAWRASSWVQEFGLNNYFTLSSEGRVTVHEPGLYLAYAQIHYLDEHDENGFHMLVNGRPLFQCMIYSPGFGHKSRSCFSAQITVLKSGDHIVLRDVSSARYTLFQRDKSFFGLVKVGEMRQPQRQHQIQTSL